MEVEGAEVDGAEGDEVLLLLEAPSLFAGADEVEEAVPDEEVVEEAPLLSPRESVR